MKAEGIAAFQVSRFAYVLALFLLAAQAYGAASPSSLALTVEAIDGAAKIQFQQRWQTPQTGMHIEMPAVVSTGSDGSVRLQQGDTTIQVAANSAIELFAGSDGQALQRVVQEQGSAFYDIAPQGAKRLRVETPYLVAVVKGTQFNVTVTPDSSTVSLFEGLLQIDAPEVGDSVELFEGEIAQRFRNDSRITVFSMADGETASRDGRGTPLPSDDQSPPGSSDGLAIVTGGDGMASLPGAVGSGIDGLALPGAAGADFGIDPGTGITADGSAAVDGIGTAPDIGNDKVLGDGFLSAVDTSVTAGVDPAAGTVGLSLDSGIDLGAASIDTGLDAGVDLSAGTVDLGLDSGIDLGAASIDTGLDTGVDLSAGTVDLGLDSGIDLGAASIDTGLDAGVDLSAGAVDLGLDSGVDLGAASIDTGLDTGVDLSAGTVDLGLDNGVDLGAASIDTGLDTGVDLSAGTVDLGLDSGVDLGAASIDTGLDAGVDLSGGTVDVGTDVAGIDLDIGLNLGGDGPLLDLGAGTPTAGDAGSDTGTPPVEPEPILPLPRLGGLLGL